MRTERDFQLGLELPRQPRSVGARSLAGLLLVVLGLGLVACDTSSTARRKPAPPPGADNVGQLGWGRPQPGDAQAGLPMGIPQSR